MDVVLLVVPVQGDADVLFAIPFGSYFVVVFQCPLEMQRMFLANVLESKVINYECELDEAPIVLPDTWNQFALSVDHAC